MPPQQIRHVSVKVIQGHSLVEPLTLCEREGHSRSQVELLTLCEREGHSRSFTGRATDLV